MNRADVLKRIAEKAKKDKKFRQDPRYLQAMGFLVAKGFLRTNQAIPLLPNQRLRLTDAIWAGKNVEPRILEVLPAAVLRLPNHFDLNQFEHPDLFAAIEALREKKKGQPLWGIPLKKYKVWVELILPDKRMKPLNEKKVVKTFRLSPKSIEVLKKRSKEWGCSKTDALEKILLEG